MGQPTHDSKHTLTVEPPAGVAHRSGSTRSSAAMPRLKTVFAAACLALSVSSLHILDARQAVATESVSRIARIEQGLLPAVQVTNAPPVKYSLAERMAHYKVPALSIAFVENGV